MVPWMSGLVNGLQNRLRRFESARHLFSFPHFIPQFHNRVIGNYDLVCFFYDAFLLFQKAALELQSTFLCRWKVALRR